MMTLFPYKEPNNHENFWRQTMKVYAELLHIAMTHRNTGLLDPKTAFISISSSLAAIERGLPTKADAARESFLDLYGSTILHAWNTLQQIEAPSHLELQKALQGLTDDLTRYGKVHPSRQNQDDYDDLLMGVDQTLCAGLMRHRVKKPRSAPDELAQQARERILSLPPTSGIYTFASQLSHRPWKVVVNDTSIFGLWDDVAARGPAKVIIGPQQKKMAVSRR